MPYPIAPHLGRGAAAALALALVVGLVSACEPMADSLDFTREEVPIFQAEKLVDPGDPGATPALRTMAWNIKDGGGRRPFWFECWGDKVQTTRAEVDQNMAGIYAMINEADPDILVVEEIEVNSKRSAYFDMVQGILDHTKLNFGVYAETWNSRWVAADGLGRMALGNAIFSRYPITKAERIRQVDRTDQDPLTEMFYIKRAIGRVEISLRALNGDDASAKRVVAMVVHTEAYDNDGTKQKQIKQIHELMKAETLPTMVGGDFNELPPTATKLKGFPDERETAVCSADFAQPPYTPEVMQPFYDDFQPWVTLKDYGTSTAQQAKYYTHSVLGPDDKNEKGEAGDWNRTIDYLFINGGGQWRPGSGTVFQHKAHAFKDRDGADQVLKIDPLLLSDHAPVFGIWEVK